MPLWSGVPGGLAQFGGTYEFNEYLLVAELDTMDYVALINPGIIRTNFHCHVAENAFFSSHAWFSGTFGYAPTFITV